MPVTLLRCVCVVAPYLSSLRGGRVAKFGARNRSRVHDGRSCCFNIACVPCVLEFGVSFVLLWQRYVRLPMCFFFYLFIFRGVVGIVLVYFVCCVML